MSRPAESVSPDRRLEQKRRRETYDALIETGFALLEHCELEVVENLVRAFRLVSDYDNLMRDYLPNVL